MNYRLKVKYLLCFAVQINNCNLYLCNESSCYEIYRWFPTPPGHLHRYSHIATFYTCHKTTEKYLCNQSSHYEKHSITKGSHHVLTTKLNTLLMNGIQRKMLVSSWRKHCTHCGMSKDTSQAETTSNSEKIKPIALATVELKASGSQKKMLKYRILKIL